MTQKQLVIMGVVAVAAFALWQQSQKGQGKAGTNYPVNLGEPSPLGGGFGDVQSLGYLPQAADMYAWMLGQR